MVFSFILLYNFNLFHDCYLLYQIYDTIVTNNNTTPKRGLILKHSNPTDQIIYRRAHESEYEKIESKESAPSSSILEDNEPSSDLTSSDDILDSSTDKPDGSAPLFIVIAVIAVVIILGVICFIIFKKRANK